jgi:hypothetical protein
VQVSAQPTKYDWQPPVAICSKIIIASPESLLKNMPKAVRVERSGAESKQPPSPINGLHASTP